MSIIEFHKKYRETLGQMLQRFRIEHPEHKSSKITYAGRLDPLAEGAMLLLTNDDVYRKSEFLTCDKTYRVDFILGFSTDTYDILGLVGRVKNTGKKSIYHEKIATIISEMIHIKEQQYPGYSSKTVSGKPLWQWARQGVDTDTIAPMRPITIFYAKYLGSQEIETTDFIKKYIKTLPEVSGNFRQDEIIIRWQELFFEYPKSLTMYSAEFKVSSGAYIRSLVHSLGHKLGVGAVCVKITRTDIHR